MMTLADVENYLKEYGHTVSNAIDPIFALSRSDVSDMAQAYKKGELYLYTAETLIEAYREWIEAELDTVTAESDADLSQVVEWAKALEKVSTYESDCIFWQELGETDIQVVNG